MTDDETEWEPPEREMFDHDPVAHTQARAGMTVGELASEYGNAGVGAADLHEAIDIYATMLDEDVTNFFGLAGAMVPTGMRRIVADLIRDGHIDALVTTGANLTHDAIEAIGGKHHHGSAGPAPSTESEPESASASASASTSNQSHDACNRSATERKPEREHDEQLREEEVDRIYNVYLPQEHFALFEDHLRTEVFPVLAEEGTVGIQRLTEVLGRANAEVNDRDGIEERAGIAAAAYENDVPIYCPAVQDSVLGLQAWMYGQTSDFSLDALTDMDTITDQAFEAEQSGAMVVGGGVPKNFVLQTMLVAPEAYDYAVQLTMDPPHTGGLSGATLDEARSWGKLKTAARNVSVYADATITLPLVVAAARERIDDSDNR